MYDLSSILKYIATSNIVNFVIMLFIFGWIIKKFSVKASFDDGVKSIENEINKSVDEKQKSAGEFRLAKDISDALPNEVQSIEKANSNKINAFKTRIEESTHKTIFDIEQNVGKVISIEEKKLSNLLADKTSKASLALAKQHIEKMLADNPDLHNQFIMNSLDELDRIEL